jgi:hypothetical protein
MTEAEVYATQDGYFTVDTENYANYFLIAFKNLQNNKYFLFEPPFKSWLLSWLLHENTTIGFNSIKYDLPLIWLSYHNQDLATLKEASNRLIGGMFPAEFKKEYNIDLPATKHIDLIEVCPLRGSLKLYGARLHAARIQDMPFNPYGDITPEQVEIVRNYCINDLDITELLLNNLKEQLLLREELTQEYNQNLMSKSDAQIAEAVISSELKKLTGWWPKKPKIDQLYFKFQVPSNMFFQTPYMQVILNTIANTDFSLDEWGRLERDNNIKNLHINIGDGVYRMGIGGLHSSEEKIAYKSTTDYQLFDRDVASFYPAIVLNCRLFPKHLGENFLQVYQSLVDRRLAAKKAKNIAVSENLKVTINGTFGKTGSPHSVIYAPEMTVQITVGGQLYLLMLIEMLELRGIQVVSANTDGIIMYVHKDQMPEYLTTIKWWEETTGFVTEETKYEALYSRDVNAYIAIKSADDVKGKNFLYDPWRPKNAKDAYWRFQKNPTMQICVEAVEKLITHNIPIEQTIMQCKDITRFLSVKNVTGGAHKDGHYLGKVIRWYYAKGTFGTINYITSNNRVPDTDGALPILDLPDNFPDNVNHQYYIDKSIEMLHEIGYLKPAQQTLF